MTDKLEETGGVKYDPDLTQLLIDNRFTCENMVDICPPPDSIVWIMHRNEKMNFVNAMQDCKQDQVGCIFTFPGNRRDGMMYVYYSTYTADEIRRIIALKAFL
jgi:hypothetical protein